MRRVLKRYFNVAASLACAVLAMAFLHADFFDKVSQELIAFFGLMMAAVLPTMILTANAIRAGGLSVKRIGELSVALVKQVHLWGGLFLLSLISCVAIVVGRTIGWEWIVHLPKWLGGKTYNLAAILNGVIVGLGVLMLLRARSVFDGIVSLIGLSAEIAISEAQARDNQKFKQIDDAVAAQPRREGFGTYTDLKH